MQITEKQLKQLIKKIIIEQKLQGLIDKINPFKKNQLSEKDLEWLKKLQKRFIK